MNSYVLLLGLAVAVNLRDFKMLMLSLVVGMGVLLPVPAANFYLICIFWEVVIGLLSFMLNASASSVVWRISVLLIGFHVLGYVFNGYPIESPYHLAVKISEHAELIACILLSRYFFQQKVPYDSY